MKHRNLIIKDRDFHDGRAVAFEDRLQHARPEVPKVGAGRHHRGDDFYDH